MDNPLSLDTIISFGKYKNNKLAELLKDKGYTLWVIENCTSISKKLLDTIKFYYNKDIKDNNKPIIGINLTSRIKSLLANRIYDDIISWNIPNINLEFTEKQNIISTEFIKYIHDLHLIYPSGTGCFIDYLFRYILYKFLNITFHDSRADRLYTELNNLNIQNKINDEIKFKLYEKYKNDYIFDEFLDIYETIKKAEYKWFEMQENYQDEQYQIWKQKYTSEEINLYNQMGSIKLNKKWRKKWEKQIEMYEELNNNKFISFKDYLNNTKYYEIYDYYQELVHDSKVNNIIVLNFQKLEDNDFPISFISAYEKVIKQKNNIIDIIKELFVVSLSHNVAFRDYNKDKSKLQYEYIIKNKFKVEYIEDIINIVKLFNGKKYSLNPTLGIDNMGADADLIIDDNLIDFKVSKTNHDKYEILQLLGYSALISIRSHNINKIHVIDLYKNKLKTIDISQWNYNQRNVFLEYINVSYKNKNKNININPIEFIS